MDTSRNRHHPKFSSFYAAFFYRQRSSLGFVSGDSGEYAPPPLVRRHLVISRHQMKTLAANAIKGLQFKE
jgi:hypothetical protein